MLDQQTNDVASIRCGGKHQGRLSVGCFPGIDVHFFGDQSIDSARRTGGGSHHEHCRARGAGVIHVGSGFEGFDGCACHCAAYCVDDPLVEHARYDVVG